jgi:hypothetical protein
MMMQLDNMARQMDQRVNSTISCIPAGGRLIHLGFGIYILYSSSYDEYPYMWVYCLVSIIHSLFHIISYVNRVLNGVHHVQFICGQCCFALGLLIWGSIILTDLRGDHYLRIFFILSFVLAVFDVLVCCGFQLVTNFQQPPQAPQAPLQPQPQPHPHQHPQPPMMNILGGPVVPQFSAAPPGNPAPVGVVVQC